MTVKPKIDDAPGLIWKSSKSGWTAIWQARRDLIKRGFRPTSQRLLEITATPTDTEKLFIAQRCVELQTKMLTWGRGGPTIAPTTADGYDGTLAGLIRCYEMKPTSPFQTIRHGSQVTARNRHNRLINDYGKVPVSDITLDLVTDWRANWIKEVRDRNPNSNNPQVGLSMANTLVDTLRQLLIFGASRLKDQACKVARAELHDSKFKKPKKGDKFLTRDHAVAFRRAAHAMGFPSMAQAQAIQYDTGFRQKDVVGEWLPQSDVNSPPSDVLRGADKWCYGVRWNEIAQTGNKLVLNHTTSKREKIWSGNIAMCVMIMAEFQAMPQPLPASGPVIIDESTGRPYSASQFRKRWRKIAKAAGIPDDVCNMHNRAGAITESFSVNVAPDKTRAFAVHSDLRTTQGYNRGSDAAIDEVLEARNKNRTA